MIEETRKKLQSVSSFCFHCIVVKYLVTSLSSNYEFVVRKVLVDP